MTPSLPRSARRPRAGRRPVHLWRPAGDPDRRPRHPLPLRAAARRPGYPVAVVRVAYLLSNWDGVLAPARDDGVLPAMLDERRPIPMVAPADVGVAVADLLTRPEPATGLHFVEGPGAVLAGRRRAGVRGRPSVAPSTVTVTPREGWVSAFREMGFSRRGGGVVRRDDGARHAATRSSCPSRRPAAPRRSRTTSRRWCGTPERSVGGPHVASTTRPRHTPVTRAGQTCGHDGSRDHRTRCGDAAQR